jgi:hypothetical protein
MSRETIVALNDFIGVLMALPQAKDEKLYDEIKQTPEEKQMSILAIAERVGREEGLKEAISDILEIKFGVAGLRLLNRVKPITDVAVLQKIRAGLKQAPSVAEAERLIRAHTPKQRKAA